MMPLRLPLLSCIAAAEVLYQQPTALDLWTPSGQTRIDDATMDTAGKTVLSFWRLGNPSGGWLQPIDGDLATWTGLEPSDRHREQAGYHPWVPGTTAAQYSEGRLGVHLNLFDTPPAGLGTISLEYNWPGGARPRPWAGGKVHCDVDLALHSADKSGTAIYSTWSLGIFHEASGRFIWYETALWDYQRPHSDFVEVDSISGNMIVHGFLGGAGRYTETFGGSSESMSSIWSGLRHFSFGISAQHVANALQDVNAKAGGGVDTDPANWQLAHTNIEVEGTSNTRAGHTMQGMVIQYFPAAANSGAVVV